ncbi:intraflagellar transport 81 homolog, partial [Paramuricea clavata]
MAAENWPMSKNKGTYGTGSHVRDAKLSEANGTEADHEVVPRLVTTGDGKALEADDTEGSTTGRSDEVGEVKPDNDETKPVDAIDVEADEIISLWTGESDKSVPEQLDRLLLVSRGIQDRSQNPNEAQESQKNKNRKPKSSSQCEKQYTNLVQKLEEECKINSYLCQEKIPKDIEAKQKAVSDMQRVIDEPAMGQSDLDQLNHQIRQLSDEINKLIEKRMVRNDPIDDKLSLFRQQASIIVGKKETAAEELREVMDELSTKEGELQSKREALQQSEGSEVIKGDEFKRYVNKLRSKSTVYKKKRQE